MKCAETIVQRTNCQSAQLLGAYEEWSHGGNDTEVKTLEADLPEGEADSDTSEASQETIIIENITWQSEPEYDGNTEGEYVFTAVLPRGYVLTDGVNIPKITVTVGETDNISLLSGEGIMTITATHSHSGWTGTTSLPTSAGSYYLTSNVSGSWTVPSGTTHLCLNGKTISGTITVPSGATLNIYDEGSGKVSTDSNVIIVQSGGEAYIYGGTYETSASGSYAISVSAGGFIQIDGGTINKSTPSGSTATISIRGEGIINNATVSGYSNAVLAENGGKAYIYGGTFSSDHANTLAPGTSSYMYINMTNGGTVYGNVSDRYAINVSGTADIVYAITSGSSTSVNVNSGASAVINGGSFNSTSNDTVSNSGTLTITGGSFTGVQYAVNNNGTFKLSGKPTFSGSTADIYLPSGKKIIITGTLSNTTPYSVSTATTPTSGSPVVITDSSTTSCNDNTKFTSANSSYIVRKNSSSQLELAVPPAHAHNNIIFTPWTSGNSMPNSSGNYYLAGDVSLSSTWTAPSGETHLCLNGHNITFSSGYISVGSGSTLNIYDCQDDGTISGATWGILQQGSGNVTVYGGNIIAHGSSSPGISINGSGTITIKGGTITSTNNNGVYTSSGFSGKLIMDGGKVTTKNTGVMAAFYVLNSSEVSISGGEIGDKGYGFYVGGSGTTTITGGKFTGDTYAIKNLGNSTLIIKDATVISGDGDALLNQGNGTVTIEGGSFSGNYGINNEGAALNLSGSPTITGTESDIYLKSSKKITITGTLSNTTPYSVSTATAPTSGSPVVITDSSTTSYNNADKFTSADGYIVRKNSSSQLELAVLPAHAHNNITFTPWTSGNSMPNSSGNYYLTGKVTLTGGWTAPSGEINLCLNGYDITFNSSYISVPSGSTLNIYDCQDNGTITGTTYGISISNGNVTVNGGTINAKNDSGIYISGTGTLTVHGGTITSTSAARHGILTGTSSNASITMDGGTVTTEKAAMTAIYLEGKDTVSINGGTICNDNTTSASGAFYIGSSSQATITGGTIRGTLYGIRNLGTMRITDATVVGGDYGLRNQGTVTIEGGSFSGGKTYAIQNEGSINLSGSPTITGTKSDIYLSSGKKITITGTLGNTTPYSVSTANTPTASSPVVITDSSTTSYNNADKFTSADGYIVRKNSSSQLELALLTAHTHDNITFTPWTDPTSLPHSSGSYYLTTDVTFQLTVHNNININLCLNGHTITYKDSLDTIYVHPGGVINIYDCQDKGEVTSSTKAVINVQSGGTANIYGGTFKSTASGYPAIAIEGKVTINNGKFESTGLAATIRGESGSNIIITGGEFIQNDGGNVIQNKGTLEMSGGTVNGKSSSDRGVVGIANISGTATIKNVTITTVGTDTDNDEYGDKGLRNDSGGTMTVENCNIISSNWAVRNTGDSTFIISGGTFQGQYGIYNNNGIFELSGSPTFTGSIADIYLSDDQKITVTGALGNAAPYSVLTATDPTVIDPVEITDSGETSYNVAARFTAANDSYIVRKNNSGQLELALLATYTITYDKGTGSDITGSVPSGTKTEGVDFTLSSETFTRTGYIQAGWSTTDGGSKVYDLGGTYSADASITLYPYWTANEYDITYMDQGGAAFSGTHESGHPTKHTYGTATALKQASKKGYTFDGWYTDSKCTDDNKVTELAADEYIDDIILYAKWVDDIAPEIGDMTYNYTPKIVDGWVIGNKNLVITVPVTEEGSGADEIKYTATAVKGTSKSGTAAIETNGTAQFTVDADFKGSIVITCTDKAENESSKTVKVILEDNAPTVNFTIGGSAVSGETGYYDVAPAVAVTVTDDMDNAISSGIASVTYQVNGGSRQQVTGDFTTTIKEQYSFTIPADKIPTGVNDVTVKVEDNAGNTAEAALTVKVRGPEAKPDAGIDYILETLTGLVPGAEYTVNGVTKTVDADGNIKIEESWIGETISIIRKGNGDMTSDSAPQSLSIPARPAVPTGFTAKNATYPGAKDGSVTGLDAGYTYEISDDAGNTWKDAQWNGTDIIGLSAGSYCIRIKAAEDKNFKSAASETFIIGEDQPLQDVTPEKTPNASVDKENVTLKGLEKNAEYTITYTDDNGTEHTVNRKSDENGNIDIEDNWLDKTVDIVKKGNGTTTTDSDKQAVRIPAKEKKPDPKTTKVSAKGKADGKITNLEPNETYEISTDGGKTWETKTADSNGEITGLPAGDYKIRTKAKDNANGGTFRSDAADCKIGTKSSSNGGGGSSGSGGDDNGGGQPDDDGGSSQTDNTPPGTVPPPTDTPADTKKPDTKTPPTDTPKPEEAREPEQGTKQDTDPDTNPSAGTAEQTVLTETENGEIKITGDIIPTGIIRDSQDATTTLAVGEGSVSITVVSDEYKHDAGIADAVAVANAVLTQEQIHLVDEGGKIEIRVDVKDISQVPKEERDIIENGLAAEGREDELTLGAYIDISMYIRIGDGDWNAITQSGEAIDVVIGIPDELQSGGRTFYIARCHEGRYDLLHDMDTEAETITIQTALFSTYAIVYSQAGTAGSKCNLCHICPTFLGICCFVWLAIITAAVIVVILIVSKRRKKEI